MGGRLISLTLGRVEYNWVTWIPPRCVYLSRLKGRANICLEYTSAFLGADSPVLAFELIGSLLPFPIPAEGFLGMIKFGF
jgi:hypothetical protein